MTSLCWPRSATSSLRKRRRSGRDRDGASARFASCRARMRRDPVATCRHCDQPNIARELRPRPAFDCAIGWRETNARGQVGRMDRGRDPFRVCSGVESVAGPHRPRRGCFDIQAFAAARSRDLRGSPVQFCANAHGSCPAVEHGRDGLIGAARCRSGCGLIDQIEIDRIRTRFRNCR